MAHTRWARLEVSVVVLGLLAAACTSSASTTAPGAPSSAAPASSASTTAPGAPSSASTAAAKVTLTLWQNLGQGNQAQVVPPLIAAFEKLHPNITINNVQQPRANYFALLQAAAVSKTGPDIVNMWTGLFTMQYRSFLENLQPLIPSSDLANVDGTEWSSVGFNSPSSPYVMPLQEQFYIGFYNKKLFQQVGISSPPTTWSQLFSDCTKLKAANITCIEQGTQNLSGEFYPWYDLSYMMAGVLSPTQWEGLYNGSTQWTSSTVQSQLDKWHQLYVDGYVNKDALSATNVMNAFLKGQAAMIVKVNNDAGPFYSALGSNVGVFVPPYSDTPMKGVVEFAGNGFAITTYSPHKTAAAEFLQFMTTPQAGQIIAQGGLIPAVKGIEPTNPLAKDMLALVNQQGLTVYPMLDNVLPPTFVNSTSTVLDSILVGGVSVQSGTATLAQAWNQLPASERGSSWATYQVP